MHVSSYHGDGGLNKSSLTMNVIQIENIPDVGMNALGTYSTNKTNKNSKKVSVNMLVSPFV